MQLTTSLTLLSLLFVLFIGGAQANWTLTFSDEFENQIKLDTTKWIPSYSYAARINQELQYYTPDSFKFTTSKLQIIGQKRTVMASDGSNDLQFNYTSGAITTRHKFAQKFGYFEMKAQIPAGLGFWPAFWLLPEQDLTPAGGEIDIMEIIGDKNTTVYTTFHCNYSSNGASGGSQINPAGFSSAYHTYGVQWYPNNLRWYVDGVSVYNLSSACVPKRAAYMLANLAIGGTWPQPPNSQTVFPNFFNIEYIRVYKYVSSGGVSLAGPGAGYAYTDVSDVLPTWDVFNPIVSPESAPAGSTVNLSIRLVLNSATSYSGLNIQFPAKSYLTASIGGGAMLSNVNVAAGSPSIVTVNTTYTIPANQPAGYIKIGVGIFSSTWANYYWQDNVWVIGVGKTVGSNA